MQTSSQGSPPTPSPERAQALLAALNPEQLTAALHLHGPAVVLAGAGSGKTRVLTARIANLICMQGVRPNQVMAVTFTNKAAGEMRERLGHLLGSASRDVVMGTFHSWGARFLRQHAGLIPLDPRFTILDGDDSLRIIKKIFTARFPDAKEGGNGSQWNPQVFRGRISDAKNALKTQRDLDTDAAVSNDPLVRETAVFFSAYHAQLAHLQAVDFDDLLQLPVRLLQQNPKLAQTYQGRYQQILVDEYQDTNAAQYELLRILADQHKNLFVVGDDDQSIYGWRGANIRNILQFNQDFVGGQLFKLEQNYRSTQTILDAANAVIGQNTQRSGKSLWTQGVKGEQLVIHQFSTDRDEARFLATRIAEQISEGRSPDEMAVLYRTNAQSRPIEQELQSRQIPFRLVGGLRFYERREIKDALSYARLTMNPADDIAFERIVNVPKRGVGDKSMQVLTQWATAHGMPLRAAIAQIENIPGLPKAAASSLTGLAVLLGKLDVAASNLTVDQFLEYAFREIGLREAWALEGEEGEARIENLAGLIRDAQEFVQNQFNAGGDIALHDYLEQASLVSDQDTIDGQPLVTLMTIHAAKGLEFPIVYTPGLEEGVFPHTRALREGKPEALEEERRLFYVALTRARETVTLSWTEERRQFGGPGTRQEASRFLEEIPSSLRKLRDHRSAMFEAPRRWKDASSKTSGTTRRGRTPWDDEAVAEDDVSDLPPGFDDVQPVSRQSNPPRPARAPASQGKPVAVAGGASLTPGQQVQHGEWGLGLVKVAIGVGPSAQVVVEFVGVGQRVVKASTVSSVPPTQSSLKIR